MWIRRADFDGCSTAEGKDTFAVLCERVLLCFKQDREETEAKRTRCSLMITLRSSLCLPHPRSTTYLSPILPRARIALSLPCTGGRRMGYVIQLQHASPYSQRMPSNHFCPPTTRAERSTRVNQHPDVAIASTCIAAMQVVPPSHPGPEAGGCVHRGRCVMSSSARNPMRSDETTRKSPNDRSTAGQNTWYVVNSHTSTAGA